MKILITGGAGFLGLHLAKYFSEHFVGNKDFCSLLDIAEFDKKEYPKNCHFIKADIRNSTLMYQYIKSMDYVIHAAAALPLWKEKDIFDINVGGTKNILEASFKNKVKRVIYVSSTAVYGVPKKHPIYENDRRVGVGSYGQSKIEAENLCFSYIKKGLNVTIIRPKTFLGTHRLGVFEILFDWIHDGKKIPVVGSGNNRYQLLDVDDLVEAIYLFVVRSGHPQGVQRQQGHPKGDLIYNGAFNIGTEKFTTVKKDLEKVFIYASSERSESRSHNKNSSRQARTISKVFPTPAFFVKKALWLFEKLKLSPLYQWVYDTADKDSFVSVKRLTETLNWHPKYSNSDALIKAYRWYFKNYKEIKSRGSGVTHTVGWKQGILGLIKKTM